MRVGGREMIKKIIKNPKVGDQVYSEYFNSWLTITEIKDDTNWWFSLNGEVNKAQTSLSWFVKNIKWRKG